METIQFSKRTLRIDWRDKNINASLYLKTASDQDMPFEVDVYWELIMPVAFPVVVKISF